MGGLLFFPLDRMIRATEIGFWLGERAAERGLMSRAVRAMLGLAFDDLQSNRVVLNAEVSNSRSRALAERLDFTLEVIRHQTWLQQGGYIDMTSYAMLAHEWRARSKQP